MNGSALLASRGLSCALCFVLTLACLALAGNATAQDENTEDNTETNNEANDGATTEADSPREEIQLSFDGVGVQFVVTWLAEMTGKSIVKHKDVDCQLTIVSPNQLPVKEALRLVYRALALEGFSVIENHADILLVPSEEAKKMSPHFVGDGELEGHQIVLKIFRLQNASPAKVKDTLRALISEKAKLEVDVQSGQIMVTDTADNVRLVGEILAQLDVKTVSETTTEVIPLVYARAEELKIILEAVFGNTAPGQPAQPQKRAPQPNPKAPKPVAILSATIRFMSDRTNNRIIVTAPPGKILEIKELIAKLDRDKPADVMVRILDLDHLGAADLVQEISPMYQKIRGQSLKDSIEIAPHTRSNKLIILSSEKNYEAIKELVKSLDTAEAQDKAMRTVRLQNADAETIAEHLTDLYENRSSYSYSYDYGYGSNRTQRSPGEVRFVANRRQNAVIVIGPPNSLEQIEKMIRALDEPLDSETLLPKIYQLKYVSAFDVEELLKELFQKRNQNRNYYSFDDYDTEDRDIGKLYGKVRVTSEFYTNSIIVTSNSDEAIKAVEDILKELDVPTETGDTTKLIRLKFAKAVTLANNLNIIFAQAGAAPRQQPRRQQPNNNRQRGDGNAPGSSDFELEEEEQEDSYFPWLGSSQQGFRGRGTQSTRPVSDLVGKVRVVPDVRTNSLLISCNAHLIPEIEQVVEDLDVPTAQVLIEARIIEMSTDVREKLGVRWSPDGDVIFDEDDLDNSLLLRGDAVYNEVFAGSVLEDALRTGVLRSSAHLDLLIQFLKKNTDARVKAEPRINVADNERGKLFIGQRIPFISNSVATTEGGTRNSFTYLDVGIILEVTPHINIDGDVALRIRVESSQTRPGEIILGGAVIDTRNYRTDLTVMDGQVLVLGGIIQTEHSEVVRKVPFLGDIPLLGYFFKKKDTIEREVELMVFLRPTVTRSPEEVRRLMEAERARAPRIDAWEKEIERERQIEGEKQIEGEE